MRNFTARIACTILVLGAVDGVVGAWLYRNDPFPASSLVFGIVCLFFTFLWYRLDSEQRSFRRTPLLSTAVIGVSAVAIPYYLFRTRGFRKGVVAVLVFVSLMFGYGVTSALGRLVVHMVRS